MRRPFLFLFVELLVKVNNLCESYVSKCLLWWKKICHIDSKSHRTIQVDNRPDALTLPTI